MDKIDELVNGGNPELFGRMKKFVPYLKYDNKILKDVTHPTHLQVAMMMSNTEVAKKNLHILAQLLQHNELIDQDRLTMMELEEYFQEKLENNETIDPDFLELFIRYANEAFWYIQNQKRLKNDKTHIKNATRQLKQELWDIEDQGENSDIF